MTKKYVSLEHSIRNVIVESVGVGTSQFQGNPPGFDKRYSSFKGKHAAPPSMGAERNASLTKISQTGGPMRAEGGKPTNEGDTASPGKLSSDGAFQEGGKKLKESVSDNSQKADKKEKKDKNSNLDIITNPQIVPVKHRTFIDQWLNPEGKAYPPVAPPQPMMAIPPAPGGQAMTPRDGAIPSTTPGAVPTAQTMAQGKGAAAPATMGAAGLQNPQMAAAGAAAPGDATGHLQAASGVVAAVADLLQHHGKQAAMAPAMQHPGAAQGESGAPTLNQPNQSEITPADQDPKNWRNKVRGNPRQSEIPGMIQRDPGTHGPDNPGGTHTNPGNAVKSGIGHLLGMGQQPLPQQGQAGTQSGAAVAAPMPQGKDQSRLQPAPKDQSRAPQTASVPPAATQEIKPVEPASPLDALRGKETPIQRAEYNARRDSKRWQDDPKRKSGQTQGQQPDMIQRDKGTHGPDNPGDTRRPTEAQKGSLKYQLGIGQDKPTSDQNKPIPQKGYPGAQSGREPAKPEHWKDDPKRKSGYDPEKDPESIHRDKGTHGPDNPGDRKNPGERTKAGKGPAEPTPTQDDVDAKERLKYQEPATSRPKGYKKVTDKQTSDEITGVRDIGPFDFNTTQAERDKYNMKRDEKYKRENPNGPPLKGVGDMAKWLWDNYGTAGGIIGALYAAHKLGNLGGSSGSGGGGDDSYSAYLKRKSGYLTPAHHHPTWAIPTSQTQKNLRKQFMQPEDQHEEVQRGPSENTKERRKVEYLERRGSKKEARHRFSWKSKQGRETIAGMDEERKNSIFREAISEAKAKRDKKRTESGFSKTPVDTKPKLNPEPLDSLRGP